MEKKTYTRIRDVIVDQNGVRNEFASVSQAKRRSRQLQDAGHVVRVDHSEDPVGKPLDFGRKHRPVSFAEERRIAAYNAQQERIQARRKIDATHVDMIKRRLQVKP